MIRDKIESRIHKQLVKIYRIYKASGEMSEERMKYFNGFVEAAYLCGALDGKTLDRLIDRANLEVFDMTLEERRKQVDIHRDLKYFDTPAVIRNQRASDLLP